LVPEIQSRFHELNIKNLVKYLKEEKYEKIFNSVCLSPFINFYLNINGFAYICGKFSGGEGVIETIDEKSLKEIWFGEKFNNFRVNLLLKKSLPECSNCVVRPKND
jgi:radical SAM protein with 4Fe4S-binding SPASM domain